jgi:hypothetical protein
MSAFKFLSMYGRISAFLIAEIVEALRSLFGGGRLFEFRVNCYARDKCP